MILALALDARCSRPDMFGHCLRLSVAMSEARYQTLGPDGRVTLPAGFQSSGESKTIKCLQPLSNTSVTKAAYTVEARKLDRLPDPNQRNNNTNQQKSSQNNSCYLEKKTARHARYDILTFPPSTVTTN